MAKHRQVSTKKKALRPFAFFTKRLNTWDEICVDERARLRTNTIFCTLATSGFFISMLIVNLITTPTVMTLPTAILACVSVTLFLTQFLNTKYYPAVSWLFGIMALLMCAYLLYTGGLGGYSFLWIFIIPIIAVMVVPIKESILYNALLMVLVCLLLHSPFYTALQFGYQAIFRILFPIALLFVIFCVYIMELVRYKTQKQLVQLSDRLTDFAFTDPLTGAYNRHALTSHFGDMHEKAFGLSFAMLDLDHFKKVNDEYGHIIGDEMLRHIVGIIKNNIPPGALLYRFGGEEFLLIIKTSDKVELREALEKIRVEVETTPLSAAGKNVSVTISAGATTACDTGAEIKDCVDIADSNLYKAKQTGRNKVVAN